MAIGREIKTKIKSIEKTKKITSAMQLVAVSKMRRAQEHMLRTRPYAKAILRVIEHIARSHSEYRHPYLTPRESIKKVGYIIISTDRGLCGGLNINLFRTALADMQAWNNKNVESELCVIGQKGEHFFKRIGANIVAEADHLGDRPTINDLIGVIKTMLDKYNEGTLDALYLISNEFVNTMTQKPEIKRLLPVVVPSQNTPEYWDYIYEPDAREILDVLLVRYIELQVYQATIENIASEQSARMVAMKNATENAGEIIKDLQLIYNKARQAAITQEIAEIVAGADAV
ncbi:MAG: F0F1 ATP synthase subunit gamma [Gammaproteobacteria bacterium]|nr:F0F1 ATP synthase subunit gamma [Gammaproteobacteria bacterium]